MFILAAFEYRVYETRPNEQLFNNSSIEVEEMIPVTKHKAEVPKPPPNITVLNLVPDEGPDIDVEIDIDVSAGLDEPIEKYVFASDEPEELPDDIPFVTIAEEAAEFPGGRQAFYLYLKDNIRYPAIARERSISGTVYIEFIVEKDGSITEVVLKRGIGIGCDQEAIRVIKMMPDWIPAMQQKRPVRYKMILPIKFTLG